MIALPALVFSLRYVEPTARGRTVALLTGAFLLALAALFCARDPLTFLVAWELMTLLPAAVILVARSADGRRAAPSSPTSRSRTSAAPGRGSRCCCSRRRARSAARRRIERGSGLQIAIALAALVGMGTKAGLMPLHVWLPRAHPIAPAPVSALMSGVMIKVAIYALVRVLVDWLGVLPVWFGVLVLALGALSAVAGVTYALFQHDLKRLLALHSIENIGIIVLGLGACLVLRARGADTWAAFALAAALLHTLNHAVFKALLFLGAGAFEKAVGSLELDRLGGLLRRMPWTGGAFLVGAMAIAGLPPLNGFASEWLTLQALLHVTAYGDDRRRDRRRDRAGRPGGDRCARRLLLRQGRRARAARAAATGRGGGRRGVALRDARRGRLPRARLRRARPRAGRALPPARRARSVARDGSGGRRSRPARDRIAADGRDRGRAGRDHGAARSPARPAERRTRAELGVRPGASCRASAGRAPASRSRCASCSR